MKNVQIYTTNVCKYCLAAKDFFKANNIAYTEHNVQQDRAKLQEMMDKTGQRGVPVITIDNDIVIGFNEPILRKLLLNA
jgi:glutaredoxin 3